MTSTVIDSTVFRHIFSSEPMRLNRYAWQLWQHLLSRRALCPR